MTITDRGVRRPEPVPGGGPSVDRAVFEGLAFRFSVATVDARLVARLRAALAPLESAADDPHASRYVVSGHGDRFTVALEGSTLLETDDADHAVEWLLWHVNQSVAAASGAYLLVHAAGVELGGCGVILPGASGAGKTTMAAALVLDGFGYLTDELVALADDARSLVPFPKSLALDGRSRRVLRSMRRGAPGARADHDADIAHLPAETLRSGAPAAECAPRVIAFPQHQPGRPSALHRLSNADALLELLVHTVNLEDHGGGGMTALAGLVERCPCYRLDVADLGDACRLVREAVAECS